MAEIIFIFDGQNITVQCNINQRMKDICINLSNKINTDINSLTFLYGGGILNLEKKLNEITKENKITILVYKNEEEICPKCGRMLNNKKLDDIISSNNKINNRLTGLNSQIESIMNILTNKKDIDNATAQLENFIIVINKINEDIKKINNELNLMKVNDIQINNLKLNKINENINKELKINNIQNINSKLNKINENKENKLIKNEIICIYNKQEDEISLLYDYAEIENFWSEEYKKYYIEGKNNINGNNIEIYINNKKIEFNYKYKSNERGEIKVKFIFNKLLTSTFCMFRECSSLISIDLSSLNTTNVNNMGSMFYKCSSLKSIDLSSFNTTNVNNMGSMFLGCSSLISIDLSSFNTTNVKDMTCMFAGFFFKERKCEN